MTTTFKPKLNLDLYDQPIKSDKWRNLDFFKNGECHFCWKIHASEQIAKSRADENDEENKAAVECGYIVILTYPDGKELLYSGKKGYSHTLQIPVKA